MIREVLVMCVQPLCFPIEDQWGSAIAPSGILPYAWMYTLFTFDGGLPTLVLGWSAFSLPKTRDLTFQHGYRSFRQREHGLRIRQDRRSHRRTVGIGVAVRTVIDPLVLLTAEGYHLDRTVKAQIAPVIKHDPDR